jgi:3-dehydroquinate dehydratase/shikimate dehydrogenase
MEQKNKARICIPVCVQHVYEIASAVARASEHSDFVELRLDYLDKAELGTVQEELANILRDSLRPVIVTLRPAEQGGRRALSLKTRMGMDLSFSDALRDNASLLDIELDVAQILTKASEYLAPMPWDRIICSHHDIIGLPADLEAIYHRMVSTKARILKIAVQADEITDCLPMFQLLETARSDGREMIAIAMGNAGLLTRILGPSRGAFLTFGSLDETHSTAPGQITAVSLRDVYRIHQIDRETEIMGLVGEQVAHSMSPEMHNAAFAAAGLNAVYIPLEVRKLDDFVQRMVHPRTRELEWNLRGLSITAPHKIDIMKHLDWIDPGALEIGAVNTVVIAGDGLCGYNTDAEAALAPLQELIDLNETRVAVIGAGGVARALLWSLRKVGAHVTVFARDVEQGRVTANQFGTDCQALDGARFDEFAVVVNCTPLGTRGLSEDQSPATARQLKGAKIAYDLAYNPAETRFLKEAESAGCECIGGLEMLVAQAVEQFKLWTGRDAPVDTMKAAAINALKKKEP